MPIKVGFSTSVCPQWDIHDIAAKANEMGFYGVELGTVRDESHLPAAADLQTDKEIDDVRALFRDNSVEIVSIASRYAFDARGKNVRSRSFDRTVENIELAGKLRCPFVRVPLGAPTRRGPVEATLVRQIAPLAQLARIAARNGVTLLMCNTGGFPSSRAVWFVVDGASHPNLRCAWNPVLGISAGENDSVAIPRLGSRIRMVQIADASFDEAGRFAGYRDMGDGSMDHALTIDLLRGVLFDGYLMLDWPKAHVEELAEPEAILPQSLERLLDRIKLVAPELSAYKKDKCAANWAATGPAFIERQVAGPVAGEGGDDSQQAQGEEQAVDSSKPRVPKGGDPLVAARVAEAVKKARAARAAREAGN